MTAELKPYGVLYTVLIDYKLDTGDTIDAIRLDEPGYSGIVVGFTEVKLTETDDQQATLSYAYEVLEGFIPTGKKVEFEVTLGNLIHDIMLESLER